MSRCIFQNNSILADYGGEFGRDYGWRSLVGYSPWGLEESDTTERLHFHFSLSALEKEMATHSSVLAWRIPGTGEPGGCCLWGHTESDTTEVT